MALKMIGFDGDDTLWRSEDYFAQAQAEFESIVSPWVALRGDALHARLYAVEKRNLGVFGYCVKGMALSMIEAAIDVTDARITATDVHRIVQLAQSMLRHPVELLPGVREAVARVAARWPVVQLGGWGVHIPYHLTWVHEREAAVPDASRMQAIDDADLLHDALDAIERQLSASATPAE
jgi:hypothetical protein